MNVAFRVDASPQTGAGHLMRCLTLAMALKARGAMTRFVCRHIPEHFASQILDLGHQLLRLPVETSIRHVESLAHSHWLGSTQVRDADATRRALCDQDWNWLVIDHYALDSHWESILCQVARRILVIDDIADRRHVCDVLLDQNLHRDMERRYAGRIPEGCKLLVGPAYALLREEFVRLRANGVRRTGRVERVLLSFGGSDAGNYTETAIKALASLQSWRPNVDVVLGAMHPARQVLEAVCADHGHQCHIQTTEMAKLMERADLAIGAGGFTSWERCCLGLPALCVTVGENQVDIATALHAYRALIYLGPSTKVGIERLAGGILSLIDDRSRVAELSARAASLVDGKGTNRVCEVLTSM